MNAIKVFAIYSYFELFQNKPWRTNRLFSFLESKSSKLLNMCSAIQNITNGSERRYWSFLAPSPPCPHLILIHKTQQTKQKKKSAWPGFQWLNWSGTVKSARENMPKTFHLLPAWCPLGVSPNVPLLFAVALKIADDGSYRCCLWKCSLCI